jgi:tetratricopeptide (TPR) repeat protein
LLFIVDEYGDCNTEKIINYIQKQSDAIINTKPYEKGSRAWWSVIIAIFGVGFAVASLGSFAMMIGALVTWYYTPNLKTAKFCAKNAVRIYDIWPFIKKPNRSYMFYNNILANAAFVEGDYNECIKWCDEWISNADGPANDNNNDDRDMEQSSNKSEAKVLKARALEKLKKYTEAAALLTSTLPFYTLIGQKFIPLMYLGIIFKKQGNTLSAKTNLKLAAEHKPFLGSGVNQFIAFYEYADLLDQLGDGEKALEFYKKADKACKIPWSPPSNKYIAKEYRALIDKAWTIQVAVSEESAKGDMPVEQIVLSPNETAIVKLTGIHLDGSVKQIFADKLDIDIPFNAGFVVQEKYQADNSVIVKIKCEDPQNSKKNMIKILFTYLDSLDLTKVKKRVLTFVNEEFAEIVLEKLNLTDKKWNLLDENFIFKKEHNKIYIEGKAKKNNPKFADFIFNYENSNYKDSEIFVKKMMDNNNVLRGEARRRKDIENDNIELTRDFVKSAGVQIASLSITTLKIKCLIEDQADYFYISGHGEHTTGELTLGKGSIEPKDIKNEWKKELKTLIIAGCSILDIGDFRGNYSGTAHNANPGLKWLDKGPKFLLGYCFNAPLDRQGSDRIIKNWCLNYEKDGIVESWKTANDNKNGRNACAIDCSKTKKNYWYQKRRPIYFWQWEWFSVNEDGWPKINDRR